MKIASLYAKFRDVILKHIFPVTFALTAVGVGIVILLACLSAPSWIIGPFASLLLAGSITGFCMDRPSSRRATESQESDQPVSVADLTLPTIATIINEAEHLGNHFAREVLEKLCFSVMDLLAHDLTGTDVNSWEYVSKMQRVAGIAETIGQTYPDKASYPDILAAVEILRQFQIEVDADIHEANKRPLAMMKAHAGLLLPAKAGKSNAV